MSNKEYHKIWWELHKDAINEERRKNYRENPNIRAQRAIRDKIYRQTHKEKIRERNRKYQKAHPEKVKKWAHKTFQRNYGISFIRIKHKTIRLPPDYELAYELRNYVVHPEIMERICPKKPSNNTQCISPAHGELNEFEG